MKSVAMLMSAAAFSLAVSTVCAADEQAQSQAAIAGETSAQKCARWADYQGLQGNARGEYLNDCALDLRIPDKETAGDE